MSDVVRKSDLFAALGYAPPYDELERALDEAGLSRGAKHNIAADKTDEVRELLDARFLAVCPRGDCRAEAAEGTDGRTVVGAARPDECAVCGGSANAREVERMVEAMRACGLERLCVVGGSPHSRTELERLVGGRLRLRMVDGTTSRTQQQAAADLGWAERVALWGGTLLDHKVSNLYRGTHVIQFARRSIQELAREVARSVSGEPRR